MNVFASPSSSPDVSPWHLRYTILLLVTVFIARYVLKGIRHRLFFRALPGPPHNIFLGSIPAIASVVKDLPGDCHPEQQMTMVHRKYNLGGLWFLDSWPVAPFRVMIIADPTLAAQVTQRHSLPKHPIIEHHVGHLVGKTSMVHTGGALWKSMRSMFNPGFALGHLMNFVPGIVDDVLTFCQALSEHARVSDVFLLEDISARLTADIIARVALDIELNSQTTQSELLDAFRNNVRWTPLSPGINPLKNINPLQPFMAFYYQRKLSAIFEKIINDRFSSGLRKHDPNSPKPAIDLALKEYVAQQQEHGVSDQATGQDKAFKHVVIDQMKTFLFAGHDTTSSTICYIYYMLSLHAEKLDRTRQEHDQVFGSEVGRAALLLKETPHLLNLLPYTQAVIKETLRLFPIGSTIRQGDDQTSLVYEGRTYPTKGCMIIVNNHIIGRDAKLFPSPEEFIPERFLPTPDNYQEVPKDAWRPFEKGPRNCIGQELAVLEMKIMMVLTLRQFEISAAYEEWDTQRGRKLPGDILDGKRGMFGYRGYQTFFATAKPVEGMPAKVRLRAL